MKLGVLGGTFDPIHLGHLALAEVALACAGLDRVLLVPSGQPPHRGPTFAPAEDRLQMSRLAAAGHPRTEVSALEVERPGPSFTADTLRQLSRERPHDELHLILGWDAAREIRTWRQPEVVLELADLVVVRRPGLELPGDDDLRRAGLDPARVQVCGAATPEVEATEVRRLAAAGEGLAGLVDPAVESYIRRRRLYSLLASGR